MVQSAGKPYLCCESSCGSARKTLVPWEFLSRKIYCEKLTDVELSITD